MSEDATRILVYKIVLCPGMPPSEKIKNNIIFFTHRKRECEVSAHQEEAKMVKYHRMQLINALERRMDTKIAQIPFKFLFLLASNSRMASTRLFFARIAVSNFLCRFVFSCIM